MQIWPGFKAVAYKYESGCNIVIDSCARFMSTKTVLDKIFDIKESQENNRYGNGFTEDEFQKEVKRNLIGQSVIANYGNKRTYIVNDIDFEKGPCTTFFDMRDGQKMSVAKYFFKTYRMKITDKRQPMIIVRNQGHSVSIPSEFCLIDGVPDSIRSNPNAMRTLLAKVK
jgi:hypothetical protein